MFLGYKTTVERSGRDYQPVGAMPEYPTEEGSFRRGWTGRVGAQVSSAPGALHTPCNVKCQHWTLMPSTAPRRGVSLLRETHKDILITRIIRQIEDLHISKGVSQSKKNSSSRTLGVHLPYEPPICCGAPEPTQVLRNHHSNRLRMLTHRWERLGLPHSATRTRDAHKPGHSQDALKAKSPLKITPIQASPTVGLKDRQGGNEKRTKGSPISDILNPEVKVDETRSSSDTVVALHFQSDNSDLSDQEKESVQISKWAAPADLDLRPEAFEKDLDSACSTETAQVYPEVLPTCVDFTQSLSSTANLEAQQVHASDPSLAPMVARLMELERLQVATVQKERAKPARSRPVTANTGPRNPSRLRKSDLPGSKSGTSGDVEYSSVACSFTKLSLCPNSLCRCRHLTCPLTKSGQGCVLGGKDSWLNLTLPKESHIMSHQFSRPESLVPAFSVNVKVLPKHTPSRTKRLRATKKSTPKSHREDSAYSKKILETHRRKT